MSKKGSIDDLYDDLDGLMDERYYSQLNRTAPLLIATIRKLVERGEAAEVITAHVLRRNAAVWVEAQHIRAACRHIQRELE